MVENLLLDLYDYVVRIYDMDVRYCYFWKFLNNHSTVYWVSSKLEVEILKLFMAVEFARSQAG